MRGYVLIGNVDSKENYIKKYISEKRIKTYNVLRFTEPLKISEARQIKKILSLRPVGGDERVLIINMDPGIEAQNALLKTLEELTSESDIIFCEGDNLLPTVLSRCTTVRLEVGEKKSTFDRAFLTLLLEESSTFSQKIILLDNLFSGEAKDDFQNIVLSLREYMLENVKSKNYKQALKSYEKLKELDNYFSRVYSNNLNGRSIAERVFA